MRHPWHDVDISKQLRAIIEISTGQLDGYNKYELDKDTGLLRLDRVLYMPFPDHYGFIPRTIAEDSDPLDVFVLSIHPIPPLTIVPIELLGVFKVKDNGVIDDKLLAKVAGTDIKYHKDSTYIQEFLSNYKPNVTCSDLHSKKEAVKILEKAKKRYDTYGTLKELYDNR